MKNIPQHKLIEIFINQPTKIFHFLTKNRLIHGSFVRRHLTNRIKEVSWNNCWNEQAPSLNPFSPLEALVTWLDWFFTEN